MSAVMEALLDEILTQTRISNNNLTRLIRETAALRSAGGGGGGGGGFGGGGASPLGLLNIPIKIVTGALNVMASAVGKVFEALGSLLGNVVRVGINFTAFAAKAAQGTAALSDLILVFKDLPLGIGRVASIFASLVQYSEGLLVTYRQMTQSGASFAGDLITMSQTAARGMMTLDQFSKIVRNNSEIFSTFGASVQSGINRFADMNLALMGPNSRYSRQMLALGLTAEEATEYLASYISMQGNMSRRGLEDTNRVAEATVNYARELDLYAKVTGVNRKQMEDAIQKQQLDAAFKAFTESLSPEQAAAANAAISRALMEGGQGAADDLRVMFMTGGRINKAYTDASKTFAITVGDAGEEYVRIQYNAAMNLKQGSEEYLRETIRGRVVLGNGFKEFTDQFGDGAAQLNALNNRFFVDQFLYANRLKFAGMTRIQIEEAVRKAIEERRRQEEGTAISLAQSQQNIRNFGRIISEIATTLIGPFLGPVLRIGEAFTKTIERIAGNGGFRERLQLIADWIGGFIDRMGKVENWNDFWKEIDTSARDAWRNISDWVKPWWNNVMAPIFRDGWREVVTWFTTTGRPLLEQTFKDLVETIEPYFIRMTESVLDTMNAYLYSTVVGKLLPGVEDPEKRARQREAEADFDRKVAPLLKGLRSENDDIAGFYMDLIREQQTELRRMLASIRPQSDYQNIHLGRRQIVPQRPLGTLGVLGRTTEPETTTVGIEAGERVLNPVETTTYNNLEQSLQRLNITSVQMLDVMREMATNTKRNVDATRKLGGDLFA